ncbi:MAG: CHASE2 domain-containing protein [Thermoanaerobaculia bacterium]
MSPVRFRPNLIGPAAGFAAALLAGVVFLADPSFFHLEDLSQDAMSRIVAARETPDPSIVIVSVNEKSLQTLEPLFGRWQEHNRAMLTYGLRALRAGRARVVAVDALFAGGDAGAEDRDFAASIASLPVVLGAATRPTVQGAATQQEAQRTALEPWRGALWQLENDASLPKLTFVPPYALLADAKGLGTIRLATGEGTAPVRRYVAGDRIDDSTFVPSLAVATFAVARELPRAASIRGDGRARTFRAGTLEIPVDEKATFAIRWKGKKASSEVISYPVVDFDKIVSAAAVLEEDPAAAPEVERQLRQLFEGKIVVIGLTAVGLFDLRATPLSPRAAGVEIHANAIDNLLHGEFNREASRGVFFGMLLSGLTLFGWLTYTIRSQFLNAALLIVALTSAFGVSFLALRAGWIYPAVPPALACAVAWASILVIRFIAEQRRSVQLRSIFGRYVSPGVLEHILATPDRVELGGVRTEMTILFSDIRGFTSISEASEPEEVVEMLNEYLTRMVEILLRHGGTLDKFIGDAVMGFWNAPAGDPDHARHAVECAIEMIDETARLREEWSEEGKAPIRIGIGINTGDAVVGNIGSRQVLSYTVIGDAVNLASRLESKNKDYGTEIIISEFTLARIGDSIGTRYLDEVKVKGKDKAVKIYEVEGRTP